MNDPLSASPRVTAGVDTHKDTHTAAALDGTGMLLGNATFPASPAGYAQLLEWLRSFGALDRVGIEGTGSYGSGLMQFLHDAGVNVASMSSRFALLVAARSSYSVAHGNAQLTDFFATVAHERPHPRWPERRVLDVFDEERTRLLTLCPIHCPRRTS